MQQKIKDILTRNASLSNTPFYVPFAVEAGFKLTKDGYPKELTKLVIEIGEEELKANRPLLNALIVSTKTNLPNDGFFQWYKNTVDESLNLNSYREKKSLFNKLRDACFTYWLNNKNVVTNLQAQSN